MTDSSFFSPSQLEKFEKYAFETQPRAIRTNAVLVSHKGKLVYERYARGFAKERRHYSWSLAKSMAGGILGIAESEGLIHRDDTLDRYFTGLTDLKKTIRIRDLLNMSSGIKFDESYDSSPLASNVVAILYRKQNQDIASYVLGLPQLVQPGERFLYSSGDTNLAMAALKTKLSKQEYDQYPFKKFFEPLGIDATFEQDQVGTFIGSSYIYMTPRDFLKVGELYANQGVYKGKQIIPAEWIRFQTTACPGLSFPKREFKYMSYGAQVWLNTPVPEFPDHRPFPSLPSDAYFFVGYSGQLVCVIPSEQLVIVRLADDRAEGFHRDYFLSLLIQSMSQNFSTLTPKNYSSGAPKTLEYRETNSNFRDIPNLDEGGYLGKSAQKISGGLVHFPEIAAAFTAKGYCSCRFVMGMSDSEARQFVKRHMPFAKFTVDEVNKCVQVKSLWATASASYIDERVGCVLS